MAKLGMVTCDHCGRPFSLEGATIAERWEDEYQISYFSCPMCGVKYCSGVTDEEQREILKRQITITKTLREMKRPTGKLRRKMERERLKLREKARERQKRLVRIGELVLAGVELTEAIKQADSGKGE